MASPLSKQIWRRYQHAGGYDLGMRFRNEDGYAGPGDCPAPDISCLLDRFNLRTDIRRAEEIEQ